MEANGFSLRDQIAKYLGGRLLLALGSVAAVPLLNRYLGRVGYGEFSLALVLATTIAQVLGGWLQQSILRYHAEYSAEQFPARYAQTVYVSSLVLAVLAAIVSIPFALTYSTPLIAILFLSLFVAASVRNLAQTAITQAEQKPTALIQSEIFRVFAPTVLILLLLFTPTLFREKLAMALACYAAGMLLANHLLTRKSSGPAPEGAFAPVVARRMLRFGAPMGLWFGLNSLQSLVILFVFRHTISEAAMGTYAAYNDLFVKAGSVLLMPITYAVHGRVMALQATGDHAGVQKAIREAYRYQTFLGGGLVLAAFFATPLIDFFTFGTPLKLAVVSYQHALPVACIMLGGVTGNLALIAHKGLEIGERLGEMLLAACLMVAVTLFVAVAFTTLSLGSELNLWPALGMTAGNLAYIIIAHGLSRRVFRQLPIEASTYAA